MNSKHCIAFPELSSRSLHHHHLLAKMLLPLPPTSSSLSSLKLHYSPFPPSTGVLMLMLSIVTICRRIKGNPGHPLPLCTPSFLPPLSCRRRKIIEHFHGWVGKMRADVSLEEPTILLDYSPPARWKLSGSVTDFWPGSFTKCNGVRKSQFCHNKNKAWHKRMRGGREG